MTRGRLGPAVLLVWSMAALAAGAPREGAAGFAREGAADDFLARARAGGEGAPGAAAGRAAAAEGLPAAPQSGANAGGPVFAPGGDWARAEAAVLVGSQLVSQDLGVSRNIFQTVTAEAEDVGFGEHYGFRGAAFVNRYLGAEASLTRTTTEFEFSITDEEAGMTLFFEPLVQESRELALAVVAQLPLAAMTPYAAVGYGWRTSEVEAGDPFRAGALVLGAGLKVSFPRLPVALAFDYRRARYPGGDESLELAEGGVFGPTVSALTLGVIVRFAVRP